MKTIEISVTEEQHEELMNLVLIEDLGSVNGFAKDLLFTAARKVIGLVHESTGMTELEHKNKISLFMEQENEKAS